MTPDELKSIPKGEFVVMKTGSHPMRTRLRLFMDWGITFGEPYQMPENGQRAVYYAGREELENAIVQRFLIEPDPEETDRPQQRGKSRRNYDRQGRQGGSGQAGQPLATIPKKQDALSPNADGR